jgi:regulatory protein
MSDTPSLDRPPRRRAAPLDREKLDQLALAYVARFATTSARLVRYLQRKVRERGWADDGDPPIAAIAARQVELGYVDDAAFARARAGALTRRGYGERRISQALGEAGVDEAIRDATRPNQGTARRAAMTLARKRGFGPFGAERPDRDRRQKQLAAMMRAGHPLDSAREIVDAPSIAAAERWADEGDDEER